MLKRIVKIYLFVLGFAFTLTTYAATVIVDCPNPTNGITVAGNSYPFRYTATSNVPPLTIKWLGRGHNPPPNNTRASIWPESNGTKYLRCDYDANSYLYSEGFDASNCWVHSTTQFKCNV